MKKRICPFISGVFFWPVEGEQGPGENLVECLEDDCELWTITFTTENQAISCCSFRAMGKKDSSGRFIV